MDEVRRLKAHTFNAELLSEEQSELFWAKRTIEKFKKYDMERKVYVHRLEDEYNELKAKYDYLLEEYYADEELPATKAAAKRKRKAMMYDKIITGQDAIRFMQQYMDGDDYNAEFKAFMEAHSLAVMKRYAKFLHTKLKKYKDENEKLIQALVEKNKVIRRLQGGNDGGRSDGGRSDGDGEV